MRKILLLIAVLAIAGRFVYAQEMPPESKPDTELTEDEATMRINAYQATVDDLKAKLDALNQENESITKKIEQAKADLNDCRKQTLAMIGATEADVEAFRQKLGVIEGKIREWKGYSNDKLADMRDQVEDLENQLNELRMNKIALLPEFFNRIQQDAKDIKGLYREKKITTYTVGTWAKDRDCLWNIAGKIEIYGDPFMWPKIWANNTDIIRNPDIIHPGQVLQIPPKGPKDPETLKMERKYYRQKRDEMQQQGEEATKGQ